MTLFDYWAYEALGVCGLGGEVALVTLTEVQGSAPREAGARMIVWAGSRQAGTIGGGNLEMMLTREARAFLEGAERAIERSYPLGPSLGQCCGGHVTARIERLDADSTDWLKDEVEAEYLRRPHLYIFGGGHVGSALAHAARNLPFHLHWHDTREGTGAEITHDPEYNVDQAPPNAFYVVATHSHGWDYHVVRAVLRNRDSAYCGLIGSKTKRARFVSQLREEGLGDEVHRLTCPIGASVGLKSKDPAIIAAATIVELLSLYEAGSVKAPEAVHAE